MKAAGVSLDFDGVYGSTQRSVDDGHVRRSRVPRDQGQHGALEGAPAAQRARGGAPVPDQQQRSRAARGSRRPRRSPRRRPAAIRWEGKWALNVFSSNYEPSSLLPYRREMVISLNGAETTHAVSSWRRPQGNGSPLSTYGYTAKFDGKPYPVPNWGAATVTLKRVDANTIERTLDGAEIGKETSTWTLSADRKTLTVTAKGTDATGVAYTSTQVYEKQ